MNHDQIRRRLADIDRERYELDLEEQRLRGVLDGAGDGGIIPTEPPPPPPPSRPPATMPGTQAPIAPKTPAR